MIIKILATKQGSVWCVNVCFPVQLPPAAESVEGNNSTIKVAVISARISP